MNRYHRQIILPEIGLEGQEKLSNAKVLVVGAGGLGCPILLYLAGAGIGTIGIVDFDVVAVSNLHRQVLYGTDAIGKNKAVSAKQRLEDLNPSISIKAYKEKLTSNNILSILENYDLVVDGTDNFETRYLINDAAILCNKPLIYGAIFKYEGQVAVFNYKNGPSYRCLFPTLPKEGSVPNCSETGVLGTLPAIIGSMQANEVLKLILGIGDLLSGKLLTYNSLSLKTNTFKLQRNEKEIEKVRKNGLPKDENKDLCATPAVAEITAEEALLKKDVVFVDVREFHEQPKLDELSPIPIPLGQLSNRLAIIPKEKEIIVFCQSGIRSIKAAEMLKQNGFKKVHSLQNGVLAFNLPASK